MDDAYLKVLQMIQDGAISAEEDNEIRQIAGELRLDHPDFIAVRYRYRDQLSFLRLTTEEPPAV